MPLLEFLSKLLQCSIDPAHACGNETVTHTKKQAGDQRTCVYDPAFSFLRWHSL